VARIRDERLLVYFAVLANVDRAPSKGWPWQVCGIVNLRLQLTMPSAPPLSGVRVAVQQMRPAMLTALQRRQFEEFFPFFFEEPPQAPATDLRVLREPAYNLRRFSGGANLERGRYFALIDVSGADDGPRLTSTLGTSALVGELLAYAHDSTPDWTSVFDLRAAPDGAFDQLLDGEGRELVAAAGGDVIAVFDRPLRAGESAGATLRERGHLFPYQVETIERVHAFDLRRPETLDWLISALNDDFPNAAFPRISDDDLEQDLTWFVPDITTPARRDHLLTGMSLPMSRGLRGIDQALDGIGDLLAYLLNPSLGGTHVTDMIATCVLESGADCIIYPSARVDCGVSYSLNAPDAWWGWNLVDLSGATSQYTGCLVCIGRPERFYGWPDFTLLLDQIDSAEPSTTALAGRLNGWAVDGLTQNTETAIHTRRWLRALERSAMNVESALDVERTARRGRHGERARKPKRYERLSHLRAELACQNIRLTSQMLAIDERPGRGLSVGEFLAHLCSKIPLYGSDVPVRTVYSGGWFLLQSPGLTTFILLCPVCETSERFERELDFHRMAHCRSCGYGRILGEDPGDAGARAFEAVDDGLDLLWPEGAS